MKRLIIRFFQKYVIPYIPKKNQLGFKYFLYSNLKTCEPELLHLKKLCKKREVAIDIGANEGLYSYRMSNFFNKVYAFEINDSIVQDLRECSAKNIKIITVGLSSVTKQSTLFIPIQNKLELNGWASLYKNPQFTKYREKKISITTLDSFCIKNVSLIKIDVEGHELEVIQGALETIKKYRPIIIAEIWQKNMVEIQKMFTNLDYKISTLEECLGIKGNENNLIFVP
ncbi:FkbM family methyltransferase [Candidatus Uabimicrobium sp. HlEnr_7]|uniref:FkbM family methyltransferase n=1 Tax=Candidatus Uabimicrobium helgolandensis TaxID=3095367 RepID=UPI0035591708